MNNMQIECPFCKSVHGTHLVGYAPYFEKDKLCLHLTLACDCAHYFELYLHQHEGITYLTDDKYIDGEGGEKDGQV